MAGMTVAPRRWPARLAATAGPLVTVVANKTDAGPRFRAVSRKDGKAFAKRIGARYAEVSAKTGQGVDEVFLELLNATVDPEARRTDAEVATHADPATPTSSAPPPFPPLGSDTGQSGGGSTTFDYGRRAVSCQIP